MTLANFNRMPRDPYEAAAYWVIRLDSPNCGPADRVGFEAWRAAHPEHARAFERAQRAMGTVDRHLTRDELIGLGERVFRETGRKPWLRRSAVGMAAACMLVVGAALYWQTAFEPEEGVHPGAGPEVAPVASLNAFETAIGERSTVTLSDNSTITLNTDSRVSVHFDDGSDVRRLRLERGQAHFEVAKDSRRFEVYAGKRRVVALGTAFDIRLDPDQDGVLVTLVEGRVSVEEVVGDVADFNETIASLSEPVSRTDLEPGEQLVAKPNEVPTVIEADLERVAGWREGRLFFRGDALPDVVAEVNRYSARRLVVNDDERLKALRISGSFGAGNTREFIEAVQDMHPVRARAVAYDRIELFWMGEGMTFAEWEALQRGERMLRETDGSASSSGERLVN